MGKIVICLLLLFIIFFGIFALWNIVVGIYEFFHKIPYKTRLVKTPEGSYKIEDKKTIVSSWEISEELIYANDTSAMAEFRKHIEKCGTVRKERIICEQKITNTKH